MALSKIGELIKKLIGRKVRFIRQENGFLNITVKHQHTDIRYWKITGIEEDKEGEIIHVEYHELMSRCPGEKDVMACTDRACYRVAAIASVEKV